MIVLGLFVQETKERKAKADQEALMLEKGAGAHAPTLKAFVIDKLNNACGGCVKVAFDVITEIKRRPQPAPRSRGPTGAPGVLSTSSIDTPTVPQPQSAPLNPLPTQSTNIMPSHDSAT